MAPGQERNAQRFALGANNGLAVVVDAAAKAVVAVFQGAVHPPFLRAQMDTAPITPLTIIGIFGVLLATVHSDTPGRCQMVMAARGCRVTVAVVLGDGFSQALPSIGESQWMNTNN